nr:mediator of RNA polymerase II transcription subunit 17 [Ipomoea batatas]
MEEDLQISLDKLPIKRVEFVEENGAERFPSSDVGYDEKTVSLIRRIDFAWAVEREDPSKKQKKSSADSSSSSKETSANQPWPWQSLVENLQLAHQELSVIIDLINTVEANDAVTVASMTRPKQLPNELLSDLAVSMTTKLQSFRHFGKYFKQSAKALEKQVAREARFYGALIRLQQNWKIKRHRMVAATSGNEGFYIDLFDNTLHDPALVFRPSSVSVVRIEHDPAGMLAVNLPPNSCQTLQFEFLGAYSTGNARNTKTKVRGIIKDSAGESKKEKSDDEHVKETHWTLREVHRAIFDEQVFDLVNREAFNPSLGVDVTGIQENYLRLSIGQGASVSLSLVSSNDGDQIINGEGDDNLGAGVVPMESFAASKLDDSKLDLKKLGNLNQISFEIYLRQIFHEHVFARAKNRSLNSVKSQASGLPTKDGPNLLSHFCMSLAHRIFSNKVLAELECLVSRTPYVELISHPTWHSRTSSWTLLMKVPQSILNAGNESHASYLDKNVKSQFRTKVSVYDDCISVEGEGAPNVVGLFKGKSEVTCSMNRYDCDLADLPAILLQQVASQVIRWLREEALMVGIKANRDFLSLWFELEQGETVGLVAHIDPKDPIGCISWWLVMEDGYSEENKLQVDISNGESERRKFLGYLSLGVLYSTLLDLVSLSSGSGMN